MTQAAIMPDWMQERLAGTVVQPGEVELAPDEAEVTALFLMLGSQWRIHAMTGLRLGLDYAAIPATAALAGIETTPSLFADLRVMEAAAFEVFAQGARS